MPSPTFIPFPDSASIEEVRIDPLIVGEIVQTSNFSPDISRVRRSTGTWSGEVNLSPARNPEHTAEIESWITGLETGAAWTSIPIPGKLTVLEDLPVERQESDRDGRIWTFVEEDLRPPDGSFLGTEDGRVVRIIASRPEDRDGNAAILLEPQFPIENNVLSRVESIDAIIEPNFRVAKPQTVHWGGRWNVRFVEYIPQETTSEVSVPQLAIPFDTVNLQIGGNDRIIPAGLHFASNSGPLSFSVQSSDDNVCRPSVSGNTSVRLSPVNVGRVIVKITATSVRGESITGSQVVNVASSSVNLPPVRVGTVSRIDLSVGGESATLGMSAYFRDPNGQPLRYSATSTNGSVATGRVTGSTLRVSPVDVGTADIIVTATDTSGSSAKISFPVVVANLGGVPVRGRGGTGAPVGADASLITQIPDWALYFGAPEALPALSTYFANCTSYQVASADNNVVTGAVNNGILTLTPIRLSQQRGGIAAIRQGPGRFPTKVTVTGMADNGTTATAEFDVTVVPNPGTQTTMVRSVTPVSQPLILVVGDTRTISNVLSHFQNGVRYEVVLTPSGQTAIDVTTSSTTDSFDIHARKPGTTTITVIARNTSGDSMDQSQFAVQVNETAQPRPITDDPAEGPFITSRTKRATAQFRIVIPFEVTRDFLDIDPETQTQVSNPIALPIDFTVASSDTRIFTTDVYRHPNFGRGSRAFAYANVVPVANGTAELTATVTYTQYSDASKQLTIPIKVIGRGDPRPDPTSARLTNTIPNRTISSSATTTTIRTLNSYFVNCTSYRAVSSDTSVATVNVMGTTLTVTKGSSSGTAFITITGTAANGTTATGTFQVKVNAADMDAGLSSSNSLSDATLAARQTQTISNINTYFVNCTSYRATTSQPTAVAATIDGTTLRITGRAGGGGTSTITVIGRAANGTSARLTFDVTVGATPRDARLTRNIGNRTISSSRGTYTISNLNSYFVNCTSYNASSGNTSAATVEVRGRRMTVSGTGAGGNATITVVGTADNGTTDQTAFQVTFPTPRQAQVNAGFRRVIPGRSVHEGDSTTYDLDLYFSNCTSYSASSTSRAVSTNVSGSTLTITGNTENSFRIPVIVTGTADNRTSRRQTLYIRVRAPRPSASDADVTRSISNRGIYKQGGSTRINLDSHFRNCTSYTATSSYPAVARATVSGSTLIIDALFNGRSVIVVKGTASNGTMESTSFVVTVSFRTTTTRTGPEGTGRGGGRIVSGGGGNGDNGDAPP